jgi:hypothetical protein
LGFFESDRAIYSKPNRFFAGMDTFCEMRGSLQHLDFIIFKNCLKIGASPDPPSPNSALKELSNASLRLYEQKIWQKLGESRALSRLRLFGPRVYRCFAPVSLGYRGRDRHFSLL